LEINRFLGEKTMEIALVILGVLVLGYIVWPRDKKPKVTSTVETPLQPVETPVEAKPVVEVVSEPIVEAKPARKPRVKKPAAPKVAKTTKSAKPAKISATKEAKPKAPKKPRNLKVVK
jgi:outer membrane biosynthesis protein TonB